MKNVKINKEQKLYVIPSGNGFSCLGFKVASRKAEALNKELSANLKLSRAGSKNLYAQYTKLLKIAAKKSKTGWRSQSELIPEFIGREGWRVEVVTSYGETNRFIIGRSTGFIPCHLEIKKSNSYGGVSVMGYPFKSLRFIEKVR